MDNRPIGFFDSGLGGLPYLRSARQKLPAESFVYLADTANFPYGEKSAAEVRHLVMSGIDQLRRIADPKLIVVACNTASVVALSELRREFRVPFVGVVPAVKPAAKQSARGRIVVLATNRTVDDAYVSNLIHSFAADCEVSLIADEKLVRFVEHEFDEREEERAKEAVSSVVAQIKERGADSVVLACTHFTLLDRTFITLLGDSVSVVDSREGVAQQIARQIAALDLGALEGGKDRLYVTGPESDRYRGFAASYALRFEGQPAVAHRTP